MIDFGWYSVAYALIEILFVGRAIIRPYRTPASRIAWVVVIGVIPVAGIIAYVLLGETNVGSRRLKRVLATSEKLKWPTASGQGNRSCVGEIPEEYSNPFEMAESINGFPVVGGNAGMLSSNSNHTIDRIIEDIDAAEDHVHILFYIWLPDNNGRKVAEALIRAVGRGVVCRAMVDNLGSRNLIDSDLWTRMGEAGVKLAIALPIGNIVLRPLFGRIDLRNHRKIVVIDHEITYCGSQNCADPEFRIKAKFAPWVDAVMRFTGPIARQNQYLFISDWMTYVDEDLKPLVEREVVHTPGPTAAVAFGTGPTIRNAAMPEVFTTMMYTAQREIIISSPYYVPNESMLHALCAAANRGIDTTIIFPARNDSRIVAAASESYYPELLAAGIKVYEYPLGLLHTKSFTVDGCVTLIGSANMDRRSFELNYENNILFYSEELTGDVRQLQQEYLSHSKLVSSEKVENWSVFQRLWRNSIAMLSPVL